MRNFEEELRMEKAQLAAKQESLQEQEKVIEEKMMKNSTKLLACLWVLIAIFFLLLVSEIKLVGLMPEELKPILERITGYGKWIVAGTAVSIYLLAVYMGWFGSEER